MALAVRNRTSTTNSLDLLLGIKRMGEQTDEVPGLFSNNECNVNLRLETIKNGYSDHVTVPHKINARSGFGWV